MSTVEAVGPIHAKHFNNRSLLNTLAPIAPYLNDPDTFELRVNKFGQLVSVTTRGRVFHDLPWLNKSYLEKLTGTLLNANGLDPLPVNDLMLPDGSRVVIAWPPAVLEGTVLMAIRKHLATDKSLEELRDEGRFRRLKIRTYDDAIKLTDFETEMIALRDQILHGDADPVDFLKRAVEEKLNIAVAGSTGSGKTTFTRSLMKYVPRHERVIILQDTHEVGTEALDEVGYLMYGEQEGRLSPRACLKTAMRMSPDRIFLTELRDDAAWDYLTGANTGHRGNMFSTHSNSAGETPTRIADLVKSSEIGRMLDYDAVLRTIHATIDVILYMENWDVVELLYDPLSKKQSAARR
ncbi:ATPase, T2SS/T4P/T4SS family [Burkholderia ambifaria]|uniref:ATPase, T2SS/T4P/T4SS family n=1 Tax=Burkholderia ambifaria TaxID=152480 RepID=UPI00339ABA0C